MKEKSTTTQKATTEQYVAPHIEVIRFEIAQNILGGGGSMPDMPPAQW